MRGDVRRTDEDVGRRERFVAVPETGCVVGEVEPAAALERAVGDYDSLQRFEDFGGGEAEWGIGPLRVRAKAAPVSVERERPASIDADRGEEPPSVEQPCLARR
jgi:hypothetical protein